MPHADDLAVVHGPDEPGLVDTNIGQLLDQKASDYASSESLVAPAQKVRWNFEELRTRCRKTANNLIKLGLRPGDRVVVLAGNSAEFVELFLAVTAIGAVVVILNVTFSTEDAIQAIDLVDPWAVVVARRIGFRNNEDLVDHLVKKLGVEKKLESHTTDKFALALYGDDAKVTSLASIETSDNDETELNKHWATNKQDVPCCFQFTSGTTGQRKASMLTQINLVNNAYLVGKKLELTDKDSICGIPPLAHCFGLVCGLLAGMMNGCKFVLPSEVFSPVAVCSALEKEQCTVAHAVPAMFEAMVKVQQKAKTPGKFALRTGIIAGSKPPVPLLEEIEKLFGLSKLIYPFGMTELSAVSFATTMDHDLKKDNTTVGRPMAHTWAKVIDEDGQVAKFGDVGELCVAGYLVHQGYYKNPEKTAEAMHTDENGRKWLQTGDLVTIDKEGLCRIVGRAKDMIKKGGENIVPQDIEDILLLHPDIERAAVVGIADEKWGEAIVAFTEGASDDKTLKSWLREHKLAPHKMPDHFFGVGPEAAVQEIPINATGKILKMELRTKAQELVAA